MSKAIISNRIYLSPKPEELELIKNALTYNIRSKYYSRGLVKNIVETIRNYKIYNNIISIPQGRADLIPPGTEIVDKRVSIGMPFPEACNNLRSEQLDVYSEVKGSCFINAPVGWGKTITALHIAKKLEQKTLIITHTAILRDQWIQEIQKTFGMEAGIIGSGKMDLEPTIVVGNIQTASKNVIALSKEFGTVIMDEAHHCPATTFTELIDGMHSKNRIALSGTRVRKDGRHVLFNDYFGDLVIRPEKSNTIDPSVLIIPSGIDLSGPQPWVRKINDLLYSPNYITFISNIAKRMGTIGHKVLIVGDRVEFLAGVKNNLGNTCSLLTGDTTLEGRDEIRVGLDANTVSYVAGSRQIVSEGISLNPLSCIILASPIANNTLLEQLIGRIMRISPNKLDPVVVDITFSGSSAKRQNALRVGFYTEKGWKLCY